VKNTVSTVFSTLSTAKYFPGCLQLHLQKRVSLTEQILSAMQTRIASLLFGTDRRVSGHMWLLMIPSSSGVT
jgi:hypothetical protein